LRISNNPITFCFLLLLFAANLFAQNAEKSNNQPNIVIILADDLGWNDVGFHNEKLYTPHIDRIAKEGMELERFYVSPICTPTRAALMTGKYAGRMGLNKGVIRPNRRIGLDPDEKTIPEYGHYGGMVNYFNHKRRSQLDWHRGYESSYDEGYTTDLIATESVRFIESVKANHVEAKTQNGKAAPFFLYASFNAPHSFLQAKEHDLIKNGYDKSKPIFMAKGEDRTENKAYFKGRGNTKRQTFCAMVSSLDQNVGRILAALEREGYMENTIVFFISDNGGVYAEGGSNAPLRGGKGQVYEGGVRATAAVMWQNGGWTGGKTIDDVLGHIDMFPTLQAIATNNSKANDSHLASLDGQNVAPILHQQKSGDAEREFYLGRAGFISGKWKYAHDHLFNILEDPNELKDVRKANPKVAKKLKKRLLKLREEIEKKIIVQEDFPVQPEWRMPE